MTDEKKYVAITEPDDGKVKELTSVEAFMEFQKEHKPEITLTEKEADLILGYMEGHGYELGVKDGQLLRGDMVGADNVIYWEEYSMDDAIDVVCEWNYQLIKDAEAKRNHPNDFIDFANAQSWYNGLKAEEVVLDSLFEKTKYYERINEIAEKLADDLIASLGLTGKKELPEDSQVEQAVAAMAEQVREYGSGGRSR